MTENGSSTQKPGMDISIWDYPLVQLIMDALILLLILFAMVAFLWDFVLPLIIPDPGAMVIHDIDWSTVTDLHSGALV